MKRKTLFLGICTALLISSCKSDDSGNYTPININTQPDIAEVFQNVTVEIDVLANDTNVPSDGQLTLTNGQTGTTEVLDPNNTPNIATDDVVRYTPSATFTGDDTFQYTICDAEGRSCSTETVTVSVLPFSPVNYDLANMPYDRLSDYNFFEGAMVDQNPVYGVLPYKPISTLFTDYALKKRFVWVPTGSMGTFSESGDIFDLPIGSILIKTFYYDNVLPNNDRLTIETRIMILKQEGWIFADYIWNEDQTEAFFNLDGGFVEVNWLQDGQPRFTNYRIPGESECLICHKAFDEAIPIGIKPQNLNSDYAFEDGVSNQLQKWVDIGYLDNNIPANINTVVDWQDASFSLDERARSYLDINCAHCHSDRGHCDYRSLRLDYDDTVSAANLGVCVDPDTPIPGYEDDKIITAGDAQNSILYYRLTTNKEQYRMPLRGRSITHDESLELIEEWINGLDPDCN